MRCQTRSDFTKETRFRPGAERNIEQQIINTTSCHYGQILFQTELKDSIKGDILTYKLIVPIDISINKLHTPHFVYPNCIKVCFILVKKLRTPLFTLYGFNRTGSEILPLAGLT
jgi:hypothetical protein